VFIKKCPSVKKWHVFDSRSISKLTDPPIRSDRASQGFEKNPIDFIE